MNTNGGEALIKSLELEGVEVIFGLPGGAILPVYDPIIDSPIRHILVRHEQGAGHMAEGYAHATGRPGVAMVTSRPGRHQHRHAAVRRLHGLDPDGGASPARCPPPAIGTDAFQECDTIGITRSVTKHNELVTAAAGHPPGHPPGVPHRHHRSPGPGAGRHPQGHRRPQEPRLGHGLVLADRRRGGRQPARLQAHHQGPPPQDPEAAELILAAPSGRSSTPAAASSRPGPPRRCGSWPSCTDIHVVTTLMARGAFPDDHPLCLGMPGMHGNYTAVTAMQQSDLLIALGSRFDDRVTGKVDGFAPDAKIIHVDIDPAELGKVRRPDVPHRRRLPPRHRGAGRGRATAARRRRRRSPTARRGSRRISGWQEKYPLTYEQSEPGELLKPQFVLEQLREQRPGGHDRRLGRRPAPDVDLPVLEVQPPLHLGQLRRPGHHGLLASRPPSAPRSAGPTAWCGPSTATAASR